MSITYVDASKNYQMLMAVIDDAVNEPEFGSDSFIEEAIVRQGTDGGWFVDYGTVLYSLREMGEEHAADLVSSQFGTTPA